jgi:hypothetical protein
MAKSHNYCAAFVSNAAREIYQHKPPEPLVTYALSDADKVTQKMAEDWRARQDSNLRPQA